MTETTKLPDFDKTIDALIAGTPLSTDTLQYFLETVPLNRLLKGRIASRKVVQAPRLIPAPLLMRRPMGAHATVPGVRSLATGIVRLRKPRLSRKKLPS